MLLIQIVLQLPNIVKTNYLAVKYLAYAYLVNYYLNKVTSNIVGGGGIYTIIVEICHP